jgi:DNA-binding NtrC family response regulator
MKSRKILIASQDDSCASKLSEIFHGVEMVKTVSDMIRQVKNGRFQVILLDEEVEGIKATDLVPIVKKMNPKIQIVAISSEGSIESARRLREAGIFYQAMKPLDIHEIKSAVSCAFDKIERENLSEGFFSFLRPNLVPA